MISSYSKNNGEKQSFATTNHKMLIMMGIISCSSALLWSFCSANNTSNQHRRLPEQPYTYVPGQCVRYIAEDWFLLVLKQEINSVGEPYYLTFNPDGLFTDNLIKTMTPDENSFGRKHPDVLEPLTESEMESPEARHFAKQMQKLFAIKDKLLQTEDARLMLFPVALTMFNKLAKEAKKIQMFQQAGKKFKKAQQKYDEIYNDALNIHDKLKNKYAKEDMEAAIKAQEFRKRAEERSKKNEQLMREIENMGFTDDDFWASIEQSIEQESVERKKQLEEQRKLAVGETVRVKINNMRRNGIIYGVEDGKFLIIFDVHDMKPGRDVIANKFYDSQIQRGKFNVRKLLSKLSKLLEKKMSSYYKGGLTQEVADNAIRSDDEVVRLLKVLKYHKQISIIRAKAQGVFSQRLERLLQN